MLIAIIGLILLFAALSGGGWSGLQRGGKSITETYANLAEMGEISSGIANQKLKASIKKKDKEKS